MIKLSLPDKPIELTEEVERALIEQYLNDKKDPVWQKSFIKESVFNIAYGKCAYSETVLREEGKDMQIDHFYPKVSYFHKVVEWGNLLPSLNHCNRHKSNKDPSKIELVNPLIDDPKDFFYFRSGFLCYKNAKGENTINTMKLDDQIRLNIPRGKLVQEIRDTINDLEPWIEKNIAYFIMRLKVVMRKGTRKMAYSAAVATFILENNNFISYKEILNKKSLWDSEFEDLEKELEFCSLPR